jgi:ABC-type lipoprotein export system ATPase subunit
VRLVADQVVVRYPRTDRDVLAGASLTVDAGESVAVLGPSGSGKSTMLSVLGGLVRPAVGAAYVDAAPPAPRLRDVTSWVLQTTNALPERSALDNVALAALTRGVSRPAAHAQARERLAQVGLAARADDPARVLSGGELQRVVIARALAGGRPFVLADEPTGQLDHATSMVVLDALLEGAAGASGTGVVVVTHDPEVAARCTRTVRIEDGKVLAS